MKDENEKKSGPWSILGLVALIVVLFIGIKLVFAVLEVSIAQEGTGSGSSSQIQTGEEELHAPEFCPYCGEELNDSFQWGQFCPYCGEEVEQ